MAPRAPLIALLAVLAVGCGSSDEGTPATCLVGPGAYLAALETAPAPVRLGGETPIGSCLVADQEAGELVRVGGSLVRAATELNARARTVPGSAAALQLGYLVGAMRNGAEGTAGIHADLVRRVEAAATLSPTGEPLPGGFDAAYDRGLEAGRADG